MDEREFEKVYWELHPQLLRYAKKYLDPAGSEDVVSASMLKVWDRKFAYPSTDEELREVRTYAYQTLSGSIRNEYRSRRRRKNLRFALATQAVVGHDRRDDTAMVDSKLTTDQWLSQLSESDREIVLLFNLGFATEEIAAILNCSPSAAAKRRSRARTRLQAIVDAERRSRNEHP